ncbi:MAG: DUF2225 domain-containing protein [Candidatus Lokiarchaeota archaeon]|nr:DUF2225 domain-containing protein [Candidatus Lokiarchaeota archaeon]
MTTFAPITLNCPACHEDFESSVVASCGYASTRSDYRPNYWGANPTEFHYHLCPSCGFCGRRKVFELTINISELNNELKELPIPERGMLSDRIVHAIKCLELLVKHKIMKSDPYDFASEWVTAYWWARNKNREKQYAMKALNLFEKAFSQHLIPLEQRATTKYLMGEINRRIGRKEEAHTYFDEVIELTKKGTQIHDLALRQKTAPEDNI